MNALSDAVRRHPAAALGLLAFGFGAVIIVPVVAGVLPTSFVQLGALSASAAGFVLAGVAGGRSGVRDLLARGAIWRVGPGWWLFALAFPALPTIAALYLTAVKGGYPVSWSRLASPGQGLVMLLLLILFAGIGEEFGWRGFALPRLQRSHSALGASLIVAGFHAAWHLPLFLVRGEMYHTLALQVGFVPAFLGYALLVTALTVQFTWMFNNTRGSVLLAAVYHGSFNAWNGYLDVYRGNMANLVTYVGLMLAIAVLTVAGFGPDTLSRRPDIPGRTES